MLEIKNAKKYFTVSKGFGRKDQVKAVDDVCLSVKKGIHLGLVGESGCGKTTLSRLVMQLLPADQGEIIFESQDINRAKGRGLKNFRQQVQMVFQDPYNSLDPRMTIEHIIQEALHLERKKDFNREQKFLRICEVIRAVGLKEEVLNRYPHEFSGGERQRIAIARALVVRPKLIILDEAVSSLDVIIQNEILNLLMKLGHEFGVTYLFITHNLKVVRKVCQEIAVMYQGKIIEQAKVEEIFENPIHPYTQQLLKAAVNYQSLNLEFNINPASKLVESKPGHFVLQ